MIFQHFLLAINRYAVQKEVTSCDTFQHTKKSNKQYGKLPAKEYEETPLNILCIDLIGTCIIMIKVQKDNLKLNDPNMIDPVK